jgi:hypothetical protein
VREKEQPARCARDEGRRARRGRGRAVGRACGPGKRLAGERSARCAHARRVAGPAFPWGGLSAQGKARRRVHRRAPGPQGRRPGVRTSDRPALATWTASGPGTRAPATRRARRPGVQAWFQFPVPVFENA